MPATPAVAVSVTLYYRRSHGSDLGLEMTKLASDFTCYGVRLALRFRCIRDSTRGQLKTSCELNTWRAIKPASDGLVVTCVCASVLLTSSHAQIIILLTLLHDLTCIFTTCRPETIGSDSSPSNQPILYPAPQSEMIMSTTV